MKKEEIFDRIKGKVIVSCQAVPGEPLYVEEKSIMYLMARAAKQAGAPAIRTSSIRDVIAIKEETGLPVIGLVKVQYDGFESYITPTMKEVDGLVAAGSDVIALDCTEQKRGDGRHVSEFIKEVREKYPEAVLMADISTYEEGVNAWKLGVDLVGTSKFLAINVSGVSGPKLPRKMARALHPAALTSSTAFSMSFSFSTVVLHS